MNNASIVPAGLPALDADSERHRQAVENYLLQQIHATGTGFMPFEQWMDLALYAPGLGYYAAGSVKFGGDLPIGDFATAPELTPLFGQVLANQVAQVLQDAGSTTVLEFGAGSGALAAAVIPALRRLGIEPEYQILEVSAELRARQQARLAPLDARVQWLSALPETFSGCVLANEVLDAMPAALFRWDENGKLMEIGVSPAESGVARENATAGMAQSEPASAAPFQLVERPASSVLQQAMAERMPPLPGYQSEINLRAEAWIAQMGVWLQRGAALLIDYGFPQREYYHPQRNEGTLMCHFRHHAHSQPLIYAGLQDITAHVDFTAMADAALEGGLDVLGYTSQARFLMNAGLAEALAASEGAGPQAGLRDAASAASRANDMAAIQKLISEAEMGELFKVLAIGRGLEEPLAGFSRGDRRDRL
ncbi:class I SAM-dependent methyltransferase [Pollutimonas sp. M17]|uniref:class I SAM-dependent methyltransferase n=1 Tax=Pollutimonas sp. M17 TaxID=2962065 RepID=UPI0021F40CC8|nr:SAM-dependent methyltransferase [Pollutimonas sp. M17]UYO94094.1 SAM-dependent methyltransferase [Pollutimonas sp. M17]